MAEGEGNRKLMFNGYRAAIWEEGQVTRAAEYVRMSRSGAAHELNITQCMRNG